MFTGRSLHCQIENHVRTILFYFSKLHQQNGSKLYYIIFSLVDIHGIYYIVKLITKFDDLLFLENIPFLTIMMQN